MSDASLSGLRHANQQRRRATATQQMRQPHAFGSHLLFAMSLSFASVLVARCAFCRCAHRTRRISGGQKPGLSCAPRQLSSMPLCGRSLTGSSGFTQQPTVCISRCAPTPFHQTDPNHFLRPSAPFCCEPKVDLVTMAGAWRGLLRCRLLTS